MLGLGSRSRPVIVDDCGSDCIELGRSDFRYIVVVLTFVEKVKDKLVKGIGGV